MGSRGKSKLRDVKTKEINQRERVIRFFFKVSCSFMCLEERNGKKRGKMSRTLLVLLPVLRRKEVSEEGQRVRIKL